MSVITLEQLLSSRDERCAIQRRLLAEHPNATLVCVTVIIPGNEKRTRESLVIARAAAEALHQVLGQTVTFWEERDLETGFELFAVSTLPLLDAKRSVCAIEENHPLGRLFDIDVIGSDGIPVSRDAVGCEARRCLLCHETARHCMRQRTHTTDELLQYIKDMVNVYQTGTEREIE